MAVERLQMKRLSVARVSIAVGLVALAVGVAAQRGGGTPPVNGECPAGMTLVGVGSCRAPEFPPRSIVDDRPKATLVTVNTGLHPKAKFPVIDIHAHVSGMLTPQALPGFVA